jgi:hypothetical protein
VYTTSVTLVAGTDETGAAGVLLVGFALHFVQTVSVEVEVMMTVEGLGEVKTVVLPAWVTVSPIEQVDTLVETTTVVRSVEDVSTGEFGVDEAAGVDTGAGVEPVNGIEVGQLVMRPGF